MVVFRQEQLLPVDEQSFALVCPLLLLGQDASKRVYEGDCLRFIKSLDLRNPSYKPKTSNLEPRVYGSSLKACRHIGFRAEVEGSKGYRGGRSLAGGKTAHAGSAQVSYC